MLQTIRKERPGSVYELASLLGRDRKSVTDDLRDLEFVGLVHIGKRQVGRRKTTVPSVSYSRIEIGVPV